MGRMRCTFVLVYTLHDDLADAPVSLNRRGGQFGRNDVLKQPGSVKEGHVRWPRRGWHGQLRVQSGVDTA